MSWKSELDRFKSMSTEERVSWLAHLMFFVSMLARGTYEPGTNGLDNATDLRRFNELLHRIATHQLKTIDEDPAGMPDEIFFTILDESTAELNTSLEPLFDFMRRHTP